MNKEAFIKDAAESLLETLIWSDAPEGTRPRPTKTARAESVKFVKEFVEAAGELVEAYEKLMSAKQFGHDLWLTCQGHGAGFWDRKELEDGIKYTVNGIDRNGKSYTEEVENLGQALTELAHYRKFSRFEVVQPEFYKGWAHLNLVDRVVKLGTK